MRAHTLSDAGLDVIRLSLFLPRRGSGIVKNPAVPLIKDSQV